MNIRPTIVFLLLICASKVAGDSTAALVLNASFTNASVESGLSAKDDVLAVRSPAGADLSIPIQYEAGEQTDRNAQIIDDPTQSGNKVLQFWLKNACVPGMHPGRYKGRVQLHIPVVNRSSVYQRHRIYLHPDLENYRLYPKKNKWFSVLEMRAGTAKEPYSFRIILDLVKDKGEGRPLYFLVNGGVRTGGAKGKGEWRTIWEKVNEDFEVPVGEWLDVEMGYRQGNKSTGKFYLAAKRPADANMITIFEITNWTYHPRSPKPVALSQWQPLKLYTSQEVIDFIRSKGGVAQIYWDDLELYDSWEN